VSKTLCRIELFGRLRLITPTQTITHFRTHQTALLLAYLAVHRHQTHPREVLIDLLWQESDLDAGRTSLRVALSSLRKQFELGGVPPHEVLYAEHFGVGLHASAATTDLHDMEQHIRLAHRTSDPQESILHLQRAIDLYDVPLKGFYEEWVLQLQQQTAERYFRALDELIRALENEGRRDDAQEYALRGIAYDPLREEPRMALIRIYLARGYPVEAMRAYQEWENLVREQLDSTPSRAMQQLYQQAQADRQHIRRSVHLLCGGQLPPPSARLFGRESEMAHVMELLRANTTQLLTLTGEGGIGKTSLAIEVARRMVSNGQRAWFVDLTDVSEGQSLLERVLRTVGVARYTGAPMDSAVQVLGGYPSLLVLDNFEQIDASGAEIVSDLLKRLPMLQILITSRRKTGLPTEQVIRLGPLQTPSDSVRRYERETPSNSSWIEALNRCPSVQLFVQQAQTVRPEFHLTPENASAVSEICEHLEGVPLALILAASRIRTLPPAQILQAIQRQIDVLSLSHSSHPERHRSLHASLEWSYALLSPELKRAFAMLSVFAGGWDLPAATCVLTGQTDRDDGAVDVSVLDTLDALIEYSLVQMSEQEGEARYRMLEVVRRYALEKLRKEPYADDAFARHFLFYNQLAARAGENRRGPQAAKWSSKVAQEHQNLMRAIECALDSDTSRRAPSALQMAGNLWVFWMMHGALVEGRNMLDRLITDYQNGDHQEVSRGWAWAAMGAGALAWMQRELTTAQDILLQSLHRFEQEGDVEGQAFAWIWLGNVLYRMDKYEQAAAAYQRGALLAEEAQNSEALTYAKMWQGNLAQRAGDLERAKALYHACFQMAEEAADRYALGFVHYNLGQIALGEGDTAECTQQLFRCLQTRSQIHDQPGILEAVEALTLLLARTGYHVAAAQLIGVCETLRQRLYRPSVPPGHREAEDLLRHHLGEEVYRQQRERGRSLSTSEILALVQSVLDTYGG
jgi:predicted ATPase/DNA-binding SARP family transcriptional activator